MDKEKIKGRAENELDDMEIFRLLDDVIEHGDEALPQLEYVRLHSAIACLIMPRSGARKHSAFIGMIFLHRKTERSSIILMVHGMIALICRIMTMKRILRCPRIILLPRKIHLKC